MWPCVYHVIAQENNPAKERASVLLGLHYMLLSYRERVTYTSYIVSLYFAEAYSVITQVTLYHLFHRCSFESLTECSGYGSETVAGLQSAGQ